MKITWKVTLCSYGTKLFPSTEISLVDRRDLGRRENFCPIWTQLSRLAGKLSVYNFTKSCHSGKLYPVSGITFLHMNRTKLFDSSKCFLASRDNFCPYEQAQTLFSCAPVLCLLLCSCVPHCISLFSLLPQLVLIITLLVWTRLIKFSCVGAAYLFLSHLNVYTV